MKRALVLRVRQAWVHWSWFVSVYSLVQSHRGGSCTLGVPAIPFGQRVACSLISVVCPLQVASGHQCQLLLSVLVPV